MKTFVKFTGITEAGQLAAIPDGGAAGFVVEAPTSPHRLDLGAATRLAEQVPRDVEVWAVTVNPTADLVHRLFDEMGVDRIHVYGAVPEGLEFLETHHIVPTLPVHRAGAEAPLPRVPTAEDHPIFHLDAPGDALSSRSDETPDWGNCSSLVESHPGRKVVLAGGLTAQNVREALFAVRPWGVDVSRSVEGADGRLDPTRMAAFAEAVGAAEASLG
jgi:phosphoribosylanthranilate isomerase